MSNPSVFFALSLPPYLFPLNLYLSLTVTFPPYGSHLLSAALSLTHSVTLSLTFSFFVALSLFTLLSLSLSPTYFSPSLYLCYLPCSLFLFHSLFLFLSLSLNLFLPLSIHSPLFLICSALFYSFSLPPFLFNTFVVSLSLSLSQFVLSFFLLILYLSYPCSCLSVRLSVSVFLRIYFCLLIPDFLPQNNSLYISLFLFPSPSLPPSFACQ